MTPQAFLIATQLLVVSWTAQDYEIAHKRSQESGKPLLVLVGAKWCAACQVMKNRVLPQMDRRGLLRDIHCAEIDIGGELKLAERLAEARKIPCLILFMKSEEGWKRWELTGMENEKAVQAFLEKHAAITIAEKPAAKPVQ